MPAVDLQPTLPFGRGRPGGVVAGVPQAPFVPTRETAASILWQGAGRPEPAEITDCAPTRCYWCGGGTGSRGRPVSTLSETFPAHHLAAAATSRTLCRACGWTLSDHVAFPGCYASERIARKAEVGRREIVSVRGAPAERRLLLALATGGVGLWTCAENAAAEEAWVTAVAVLREAPQDVGPCRYLGAVPLADIGAAPANKFRAYHHLGTATRWVPCTDSDRGMIREWLLDPPAVPWVGVIGDGKKHAAIHARISPPAGAGLQSVYLQGHTIHYRPAALVEAVTAWEALADVGYRDDDIAAGNWSCVATPAARIAARLYAECLAGWRGTPGMELVRYLRRTLKERDDE